MKSFRLLLIIFITTFTLQAKDIESLEVDELESYIQKNVIIVDIREEKNWKQTGTIPNSYRIPYIKSKDNKTDKRWLLILVRLIKEKNKAFVLISKDGKEAEDLAKQLIKEKKFQNVKYLKGGIESWIDSNRRVINY